MICATAALFCWIDQLCIDQTDDAEVRATLVKIPAIYRPFDVIVLFPGKPCSCHEERLLDVRAYIAIGADAEKWMPAIQDMMFCLSNVMYGQWFLRIWTRQQLLYARSIRTKWTSQEPTPCDWRRLHLISIKLDITVSMSDVAAATRLLPPVVRYRLDSMMSKMRRTPGTQLYLLALTEMRNLIQKLFQTCAEIHVSAMGSLSQWADAHAAFWAGTRLQAVEECRDDVYARLARFSRSLSDLRRGP